MVRAIALVLGVLVCGALPGTALAQPAPEPEPELELDDPDAGAPPALDSKEAKRFMAAGDTMIKRGDTLTRRGKQAEARSQYERALVSYQRAYELTRNPQLYYAIGAAEEKLGLTKEALLHFRAVTLQVTDNPALLEQATQRLGALSQDVGLFLATVDPPEAQLALDGTPLPTSPMTEPVVLAPGTYTLAITADGYQPLEVKLVIEGGSESERTFKLEPVPVVFETPKQAPRPVVTDAPAPAPSKLVLWLGGGATIAFAGIATATGVMALSRHGTFEDPDRTPAERDAARDSGKTLSLATDLCLAGAVIAAGITTYYYFGVYRPRARAYRRRSGADDAGETARRPRAFEPKVAVAPWVQPSIGGLAVAVTY